MEKKLNLSEKVRKELEQEAEKVKKVLKGKDKKIKRLEGQLRQAKEEAACEYRESDALLSEMGTSFLEGFDDALHQVQKAHPDLDLSSVKIKDLGQASVILVAYENTNEIFVGDGTLGDGESAQAQNVQVQPVREEAYQSVTNKAP